MAKRQATEQITREAFTGDASDDNEERPTQASSSVLAKRKILKPRGKLSEGNGSVKNSAFQMPSGSFQFNPQPTTSTFPNNVHPKADDEANKIKALNENFINKISESNKANSIANFTPIAEKYISYYKEIQNGKHSQNATTIDIAQQKTDADKIEDDQSSSDSESDKKEGAKDVKVEGPKFTIAQKPTSSSSPFTFDPKKIAKLNAKDSDESEDDVPIQGPIFNFNKPIQDNVFKFKGSSESKSEVDLSSKTDKGSSTSVKPTSQFSFGSNQSQATPVGSTSGTFNFGAKPVETTNQADQKQDSTKSFSFNNPSNQSSSTSGTFKFGSSQPAFGASSDKPSTGFSFGAKPDQSSTPGLASSTGSAFSAFGTKPAGAASSSPALNFGTKQDDTGPSAGSENTANSAASGGATSSGFLGFKPAGIQNKDSKPFQFGASTSTFDNSSSKPSSSPFNFIGNQNTSDASQKAPESNKTGFTFGQKAEEGSTGTTALTSTANIFGNANAKATAPSNPFGGLGSTGFQWGKTDNTSNKEENKEQEKKDDDKVEEHEVEGNFAPVVHMNEKKEVQSGEENEETKFTIRAKLMEFDSSNATNPYVNKGLGELKVLRNKETSKSRIIVRADGSLRVLLNTLLSKDVSYSSMGNGSLVRIPVFSSDNKIDTYVVKVKTADDGKELLKTIEDLKS
ncbi:hypothetical protein CANMA_002796 [Candida margitis]|uniref:uncharacterized protein n=1 Tax=Candida margitis TaxID=1775924 RepID=UPI0022262E06|nr:uncharacterized protein CANMA_002796 [Candida margitis]KAI5968028.1 hypothetical protein CANMA_002796 [Candida margitis]